MSVEATDRRGKWSMRFGLALSVGLVGLLTLTAVGFGLSRITQSEDTADVFTIASELPPQLQDAVTWLPDAPDVERSLEPLTRADVATAWLRAWAQLSVAEASGDTTGLEVYFSNSALEGALAFSAGQNTNPVRQIGHDLRLSFYSEDGQVIGLTASAARLLRGYEVPGNDGTTRTAYFDGSERYDAVLVLEDGNWRIQHWVRRGVDGSWWNEPLSPGGRSLDVSDQRTLAGEPDHLFGAMPSVVFDPLLSSNERDAYLGSTTEGASIARFEISPDVVSEAPGPTATTLSEWLEALDRRGVRIVATLFHGHRDHRPEVWNSDDEYLGEVIPELSGHSAVLMYDLRHWADLDTGPMVDLDLVHAWLSHVGRTVRSYDSETPITIGWSNPQAALASPGIEDVVTFGQTESSLTPDNYGDYARSDGENRQVFLLARHSE